MLWEAGWYRLCRYSRKWIVLCWLVVWGSNLFLCNHKRAGSGKGFYIQNIRSREVIRCSTPLPCMIPKWEAWPATPQRWQRWSIRSCEKIRRAIWCTAFSCIHKILLTPLEWSQDCQAKMVNSEWMTLRSAERWTDLRTLLIAVSIMKHLRNLVPGADDPADTFNKELSWGFGSGSSFHCEVFVKGKSCYWATHPCLLSEWPRLGYYN